MDQYGFGFTGGHDIGRHEGLVAGHAEGFAAGQPELIRILDAGGLVVYERSFAPASYVRETFGTMETASPTLPAAPPGPTSWVGRG